MGLFGGDKKKQSGGGDDAQKRKGSRRVVAPGAPRSGSDPKKPVTSRVKRGGSRPGGSSSAASKPTSAKPRPSSKPGVSALDPRPGTAGHGDEDVLELDLDASSGGHQAIDFGEGSSLGGICRTGDAALIDFLVNKASLLNAEQVAQAQGKAQAEDLPIDVACTKLGFFSEDQLVKSLTEECWVPHLKVEKYAIRKKALDTIQQTDAIAFGVLPVDKLGSILNLAMVNPLDVETIRMLEQKTGLDIKKVVATRSEIEAGITKYYGGEANAADGALGIEQDIPSQRVTQMLANVGSAGGAPQAAPTPALDEMFSKDIGAAAMKPAPIVGKPVANVQIGGDDLDDIIDIDDLLGAAEAIQPVAVQPISISADEFSDEDSDLVDAAVTNAIARPPGLRQPSSEFELEPDDEDEFIEPAIDLAAAQDASEDLEELTLDEEPVIAAPSRAPAAGSRPSPALEPASRPAPPAPKPKRKAIVDLVPVREEEFQHAISHGKARVFEKWVAIQTRNRILNAVPVDPALDELLAPLYAEPTLIASLG